MAASQCSDPVHEGHRCVLGPKKKHFGKITLRREQSCDCRRWKDALSTLKVIEDVCKQLRS